MLISSRQRLSTLSDTLELSVVSDLHLIQSSHSHDLENSTLKFKTILTNKSQLLLKALYLEATLTFLRFAANTAGAESGRMPIVLATFTSSSTKFVDLSYHAWTL